ncbi:histamine H2 receptor-like [Oculina patagonica]
MLSFPECVTWLAIGLTECVAIVTLNVITVIVFIKNRNLCKRSMYLVINLAVVDMLTGAFAVNDLFHNVGAIWCNFWKDHSFHNLATVYIISILFRLFPASSLTNIAVISLERLHATLRPFRHRLVNNWIYWLTIAAVWVTAGSISIALYYDFSSYLLISFCSICLFIISVSYASIVIKVRCVAQPRHHGAASRERKLTMTLLMVTVASLLLYLPYIIFSSRVFISEVETFWSKSSSVSFHLQGAIIVLFYANSLVNPILYAIRMPEYRSAVLALFRRRPQQQREVAVIPIHDI